MSTETDYEERCETLRPLLAARAEEAEALRRLPDDVLAAVRDAGLLRAVIPTSLGGDGLGIAPLCQGTRLLAQACPASAWVISFLVMHGWLLARFPAEARAELFGGGATPLAPAPLAPTGTVHPVDGGYRLDGRWEWATGVMHADWVIVHAVQTEPELVTRFVIVPIDEVEVDDVWFTSGMCATGSNVVRATDCFVPAHRTVVASDFLFDAERVAGDGMADLPVPSVLALMASSPALGAAEAAVELFRQRLSERVLAYSLGDRQREQPAAQVRLGNALSELRSARLRWDGALADLTEATGAGRADEQLRVDVRLTAAATVRASRQIIATVAEGAGASVYYSSSPLQRLQRDVEVLKGHVVFDWDRTTELAGRYALGFGLRPLDMA